jgi:tetratricopeptide (TPR) repeat protein
MKLNIIKVTLVLLISSLNVNAQNGITLPESQNQKVSLSQWIGLVEANVTYNSPNVTNPWSGENRTGKIWGGVVPYGYHFVTFANKMIPWRAGAQTNTVFTISHDVKIEGQHLPAGKYGLFMLAGKEAWTIIFSKDYNSWGALYYDQKEDALRVTVKATKSHFTEWLTYDFIERKSDHAVMALKWEYLSVPIKIEVPNVNDLYVEKLRSDLRNGAGFSDSNWTEAINFCVSNNINLEEALKWANYAIDRQWFGNKNYGTYSAKANVLEKLGRVDEADKLRIIALKTANAKEFSSEGRRLLSQNKNKEALKVYTLNAKKFPEEIFMIHVDFAKAYTALGNKKKAIKHWETAFKNVSDRTDQQHLLPRYKSALKKLKENKQ